MILKRLIKDLGFESVSRNVFASSVGELIHLVSLGRDRHGGQYVEIKIWHERFGVGDGEIRYRDLWSPVSGMVGPEGVISSWTWAGLEAASEHVARVIEGFSSCFSSLEDLKVALGPLEQNGPAWRHLYGSFQEIQRAGLHQEVSSFRGACLGALSKDSALKNALQTFSNAFLNRGFKVSVDEASVVFHRERGQLLDCVRFTTDLYQTFGELLVFPWSNAVWRAEKRLKGRYIPLTSKRTENLESIWIRPIHEVNPDCLENALAWVEKKLEGQAKIETSADFILAMDPLYSLIRSKMAFLPNRGAPEG